MSNDKYLTAKINEEGVMEDFLKYKEEHGLDSKSAAVRKLLRVGLEAEREDAEPVDVTALEQAMFTVASVVIGLNFLLVPLAFAGVMSPWVATTSGLAYLVLGSSIAVAADRGVFRFSDAADEAPSAARKEVAD